MIAVSFYNIWEYVLRGLQYCVDWLVSSIVDPIVENLGDLVSAFLPDSVINVSSYVSSDVYGLACEWFPCDYAITCFVAYVGLACVVYSVNWILGLIPTVS